MGPKSEDNPFQKPITVYWSTDGWRSDQNLDPDTQAWMIEFLENFLAQADAFEFDTVPDARTQLAELARLDAQVADAAECPEALEWIMQAHRKHGG